MILQEIGLCHCVIIHVCKHLTGTVCASIYNSKQVFHYGLSIQPFYPAYPVQDWGGKGQEGRGRGGCWGSVHLSLPLVNMHLLGKKRRKKANYCLQHIKLTELFLGVMNYLSV